MVHSVVVLDQGWLSGPVENEETRGVSFHSLEDLVAVGVRRTVPFLQVNVHAVLSVKSDLENEPLTRGWQGPRVHRDGLVRFFVHWFW